MAAAAAATAAAPPRSGRKRKRSDAKEPSSCSLPEEYRVVFKGELHPVKCGITRWFSGRYRYASSSALHASFKTLCRAVRSAHMASVSVPPSTAATAAPQPTQQHQNCPHCAHLDSLKLVISRFIEYGVTLSGTKRFGEAFEHKSVTCLYYALVPHVDLNRSPRGYWHGDQWVPGVPHGVSLFGMRCQWPEAVLRDVMARTNRETFTQCQIHTDATLKWGAEPMSMLSWMISNPRTSLPTRMILDELVGDDGSGIRLTQPMLDRMVLYFDGGSEHDPILVPERATRRVTYTLLTAKADRINAFRKARVIQLLDRHTHLHISPLRALVAEYVGAVFNTDPHRPLRSKLYRLTGDDAADKAAIQRISRGYDEADTY